MATLARLLGLTWLPWRLRIPGFFRGFLDQVIEFGTGQAQGIGLTAEHAFGGLFDALLQFLHRGGGLAFGVLGFGALAVATLQPGLLQVLLQAAGLGLAHGLVEAAMQQRVVAFGLLADPAQVLHQFVHPTALLLDLPRHLAAIEHAFEG